jgi:putative Flp pilus-assembly TadE/G-like protein
LLFLTMLLGMVINVGRQVDNKVKLQTAADASTYSGGVVLARSMNTLAFTNHVLCEVFALTAIMREARDRHSDPMIQEILSAWDNFATVFSNSEFQKFAKLAPHVAEKTPIERKMVQTYGDWLAASSDVALPVFETILAEQLIPQLQREIVSVTPSLAQTAAAKIADEHTGQPLGTDAARGRILGVLWRTVGEPVGGGSEASSGTLPAVDPTTDASITATISTCGIRS